MSAIHDRRRAGLLIPLFSFPSTRSWGIGEIGDIKPMTAWLAAGGQRVLQLLPLNEMARGQQSPYSALSAMAIDPIFITVPDVPDFAALGEAVLEPQDRDDLAIVRAAPRVSHVRVRALKERTLGRAFQRFLDIEWRHHTERARALKLFLAAESWWLDDYALYRALHDREEGRPWTEWPDGVRRRDADALRAAALVLEREILYRQYLQWIAAAQWADARETADAAGVALFGDLPFMVDGDSADVWARQDDFHLDRSVGVPPDAFSETGQDWGMPAYRWDAIAEEGFVWLKDRARRSATLFDGYRVDHLVGFYRTYSRDRNGGEPAFSPAEQADQERLGECVLSIFGEPGAEIVAEDLGVVPDFVRASMARLRVPGCRVLRWERAWHEEGQPFVDPRAYPSISVAASGTHDTESMFTWWENAGADEREKVATLPMCRQLAGARELTREPYNPIVRDILLKTLFASGSNLLLLPIQDVFGWPDRINQPATVTPHNWTFHLPWPCDRLTNQPEARERQAALRAWSAASNRT